MGVLFSVISMKKLFSLVFVLSLMFVFGGCHVAPDSGNQTNTYIKAEVLDSDNVVLYSSSTELEQIPVLNLQNDYYLRLDIGPGSRSVLYEYTTITVFGNEIVIQEITDRTGALYTLKGMSACENQKIEIEVVDSIPINTKIQCCIYITFS